MYCITDEQIEYILNDIRRNGVEMEDLQLNLLDHICCIIEQQLKEHDDFERFYHETIKQFYRKDLHEIEVETINLLTFKNYYAMKKLMIASGFFSVLAFIGGSMFKVMHWPGAAVMLTLAIVIFSLFFLPTMMLLKTRESTWQRDKWVLSIGTLVGILYSFSTLFLVMHWPGARILWVSTLSISFFVLVPLYFFSGIRRAEAKVNTIVTTVMILGFLGLQFTLTATRPPVEMYGNAYTYIQSEQLLQRTLQSNPTGNQLAMDVQNTCSKIKTMIIKHDIGLESIPPDFEKKGIVIKEQNMAAFFTEGEGQELLNTLVAKVNAYNEAETNANMKIPVNNSILEPGFIHKSFISTLFVLNNITQLQIFIAKTEDKPGAETLAMTSER